MARRVVVTAAMLRAVRPRLCKEQVRVFERAWPEGAALTLAFLRRAWRLGLEVGWLADQCGDDAYKAARAPARAAYRAVYKAAKAHDVSGVAALAAYDAVMEKPLLAALRRRFGGGQPSKGGTR